jgi:thiol-disulfide isomerase/thioredoxin
MDTTNNASERATVPGRRRWVFLAVIGVVLAFYLAGPGGLLWEIARGELAPDIVAMASDGSEFHLHDLKGQLVLLDFWASWCGPCRESAPAMDAIHRELSEGYPPLKVVGINVGEDPATARRAKSELGMTYLSVLDADQEISQQYGVQGIPLFLLLDVDRTVLYRQEGYAPRVADEIRARIARVRAR